MDELAIKIEHVSKEYRLGAIGGGTLKGDLQSWWARKRGKEDPNSKIGDRTDIHMGERFLALDDVSFEVKKGEAVGIIGHNGAGKSTLLKLLSRVTAPTTGKISYNGRITSMLEVGTGFHHELTGRENIYMNGAILGMTKAEISKRIEEIIDFSEVRQFIDTPVKRYSSGMYVKLAFSVASHLDSEIMIMDEVLAVGDMAFQKKCLTKMREAATKEGRTVLYVSHNMNTIRQLCSRVIVLDHGKLIFDGDVEKGIAVYMGGDTDMHSDVTILPYMRTIECQSEIQMTRFRTRNEDCTFPFGSVMPFELFVSSNYPTVHNCYLRAIIHSINGDAVSMCNTDKPIAIRPNAVTSKRLEIDISQIVPGDYYLDVSIFELGGLGAQERVDVIQNLYRFRIIETPGFNLDKPWYRAGWGYINNGSISEI